MTELNLESSENIDELKKQAGDKTNYKSRLSAVESLARFKCQQSKDILWRLMMNDKVYAVQESAFRVLQAFGEDVKLPKKKKGELVKGINKKLGIVMNSLSSDFTPSQFNEKFKSTYPEEFDIYSFEKRNGFDKWVTNVLGSLPKK